MFACVVADWTAFLRQFAVDLCELDSIRSVLAGMYITLQRAVLNGTIETCVFGSSSYRIHRVISPLCEGFGIAIFVFSKTALRLGQTARGTPAQTSVRFGRSAAQYIRVCRQWKMWFPHVMRFACRCLCVETVPESCGVAIQPWKMLIVAARKHKNLRPDASIKRPTGMWIWRTEKHSQENTVKFRGL